MARIIIKSPDGRSKAVVLPQGMDEFAVTIQPGSQVDLSSLNVVDSQNVNGSVFVLLADGTTLILKGESYSSIGEEYKLEDILAGNIPAAAAGSPDFIVVFGEQVSGDTEFYLSRADVNIAGAGLENIGAVDITGSSSSVNHTKALPDFSLPFFSTNL